ncbi:zinc-dependent metalloprotease [Gallaecimonas sp. GXIMD4217]|uniref:zinc-dependent metalloprotease n=1 Tax=Gallaecimonas sp. GXIMD4217 TaxID=3131927 RepID=UPI00311B28A4
MRGFWFWLALCLATTAQAVSQADIRQLPHRDGFFDLYLDEQQGRIWLDIDRFDQPFLLHVSLPWGLGANEVGLDRGQVSEARQVRFVRQGGKALLLQDNLAFRAEGGSSAERRAVEQAFARSVLFGGELVDGRYLDVSQLVLSDRHGIAARLAATGQGSYQLSQALSAPDWASLKSFPRNTELQALLTFTGEAKGQPLRWVAPDDGHVTLVQRLSLIALPEPGYEPMAYHPRSGAFAVAYQDYAASLDEPINKALQVRHRLGKDRPITYYLDPGTPEPVRSALLDGARWWSKAFEAAGYPGGFQVELLPEDADPMDVRYNVIQWVHRATRGWSYGAFIPDPRTGEIIKGHVTLGSLRVRQDMRIAEALLGADRHEEAKQMALARLRQLAAHEVGHTLGFQHNFAASTRGNGSVMDYPHPKVRVQEGRIDLANAYGVGLGDWDLYVVRHAYGAEPGQNRLQHQDLPYISDEGARGFAASHGDAHLWDFGDDVFASLDSLLEARALALARFAEHGVPRGASTAEWQRRLVPLYLLHRFQAEAVARQLGGMDYAYARQGEGATGARPIPAQRQHQALAVLSGLLEDQVLALPSSLLGAVPPEAQDGWRSAEWLDSRTGVVFDPYLAAEVASRLVLEPALAAPRLERLYQQAMTDGDQPGLGRVLDTLVLSRWRRDAGSMGQQAAAWQGLWLLAERVKDNRLSAPVSAQLRSRLADLAGWLQRRKGGEDWPRQQREAAKLINLLLADPDALQLPKAPAIPPGSPI